MHCCARSHAALRPDHSFMSGEAVLKSGGRPGAMLVSDFQALGLRFDSRPSLDKHRGRSRSNRRSATRSEYNAKASNLPLTPPAVVLWQDDFDGNLRSCRVCKPLTAIWSVLFDDRNRSSVCSIRPRDIFRMSAASTPNGGIQGTNPVRAHDDCCGAFAITETV